MLFNKIYIYLNKKLFKFQKTIKKKIVWLLILKLIVSMYYFSIWIFI